MDKVKNILKKKSVWIAIVTIVVAVAAEFELDAVSGAICSGAELAGLEVADCASE
jgi:hypothetical protein